MPRLGPRHRFGRLRLAPEASDLDALGVRWAPLKLAVRGVEVSAAMGLRDLKRPRRHGEGEGEGSEGHRGQVRGSVRLRSQARWPGVCRGGVPNRARHLGSSWQFLASVRLGVSLTQGNTLCLLMMTDGAQSVQPSQMAEAVAANQARRVGRLNQRASVSTSR